MFRERTISDSIIDNLFKGKVIVIYGARRTGKTTLAKHILDTYTGTKSTKYFSCEDFETKNLLETTNTETLQRTLGLYDLIILDEAQMLNNIGATLKIIHDFLPDLQVIATGSSSFDLRDQIGEPLVGRSRTYTLYSFSLSELAMDSIQLQSNLEHILRFGLYPTVINQSEEYAKEELSDIKNGYLYKDILAIEKIKSSNTLINLLISLALQVGSEVSYNELARKLGISTVTVQKYIDLLEKCFVIFVLPAFSRNIRKEIGTKSKKIYFYDLGIRNAIINSFAPLNLRTDTGVLWENFCIVELIKKARNKRRFLNNYFWRTYDQQEIDFIEEYNGVLYAYEFKFSPKQKVKIPQIFIDTYRPQFQVINKENYQKYLI